MTAAVQQAEEDTLAVVLEWVQEVVEGRGESIAQMVVTTILGCIPYVGQAVDAYNILRSIYNLIRDVDNADHWIDLVLSLIALVPLFGDVLKNVFHMLRAGKTMGRILDSVPVRVRGNIEQWFRNLNWALYARELAQSTDNILAALIDVFDRRISQWVMGRQGVQRLVRQLESLKRVARQKIHDAMESLRLTHQRSLAQALPSTTAHVPAAPRAPRTRTPRSEAPPTVHTTTGGTATPRNGQASGTQRQSQPSRAATGVSGEHIADYFYVRRQHSRSKVSQHGVLYEMTRPNGVMQIGHQGLDHVWHGARLPHGYRVSDTKGTTGATHRLATPRAAFEALRFGIDAYLGEDDEGRVRNAVGNTVGDGKQMSHLWVSRKIRSCGLLPAHEAALLPAIRAWVRAGFQLGAQNTTQQGQVRRSLVRCPYDRSLITVVGPNHSRHNAAQGLITPVCRKPASAHQIAVEFVLPNTMLRE